MSARIFGLPAQFVVVVAVSLALTIFFGAWAADAKVEARSQTLSLSGVHALYVQSYAAGSSFGAAPGTDSNATPSGGTNQALGGEVGQKAWERAFLFACPLH